MHQFTCADISQTISTPLELATCPFPKHIYHSQDIVDASRHVHQVANNFGKNFKYKVGLKKERKKENITVKMTMEEN
ncbi:hypothetical protein TNCV_2794001 [Trichonephila clavipes]|nr:hypothetical protein TNCV_2794001 [Trichonephila clavipes]